jgi:hypothetical protein
MKKFLHILQETKMKLALASGSSPDIIEEILSVTRLSAFLDAVVSSEDVKKASRNRMCFWKPPDSLPSVRNAVWWWRIPHTGLRPPKGRDVLCGDSLLDGRAFA